MRTPSQPVPRPRLLPTPRSRPPLSSSAHSAPPRREPHATPSLAPRPTPALAWLVPALHPGREDLHISFPCPACLPHWRRLGASNVKLGAFGPRGPGRGPPAARRLNPGYTDLDVLSCLVPMPENMLAQAPSCRTACVGSGGVQFPGMRSHVLDTSAVTDPELLTSRSRSVRVTAVFRLRCARPPSCPPNGPRSISAVRFQLGNVSPSEVGTGVG